MYKHRITLLCIEPNVTSISMFCTITIGSREIFSNVGLANYVIYSSSRGLVLPTLVFSIGGPSIFKNWFYIYKILYASDFISHLHEYMFLFKKATPEVLWARSIYTNQQAFVLNQKPLKIIPRICWLPEQQCYAMFSRPFFPTHTQKKKKGDLATRDYNLMAVLYYY